MAKTERLFDIAPPKDKPPIRKMVLFTELDPGEGTVDHTQVRKLAANIHIWGLLTPLLVEAKKGGGYKINAGLKRHAAIQLLRNGGLNFTDGENAEVLEPQAGRFKHVECTITPAGGRVTSAAYTLIENRMRKANPIAELAALIAMHEEGKDEQQIYRLTGTPIQTQRKLLKLMKLSVPMKRALKDGTLSIGRAQDICDLSKSQQAEILSNFKKRTAGDDKAVKKIMDEDVSPVKRVQLQQALTGLPDDAFEPIEPIAGNGGFSPLIAACEKILAGQFVEDPVEPDKVRAMIPVAHFKALEKALANAKSQERK